MTTPNVTFDPNATAPWLLIPETPSEGNFAGRTIKKIKESIEGIAQCMLNTIQKVMTALGLIRKDRNIFAYSLSVGLHAFSAVKMAIGKQVVFEAITKRLVMTNSIIDNFQTFESIGYFFGEGYKKDTVIGVVGQAAWLAASVGGLALFLGEMTLLTLSKISSAIGSIPIFGMATRLGVSLGTTVTGLVGIGFVCLGAKALGKILDSDTNEKDRTQAWWNLAWCVAEVALKTFIVVGALVPAVAASSATPFVLIGLGVIAAGLGVASYLNGQFATMNEKKVN